MNKELQLPPLPPESESHGKWAYDDADMIAYAVAAVEAEREACALVAEQGFRYAKDGYAIADDIRARGEA